jgi:putative aminopeptidase FrvX
MPETAPSGYGMSIYSYPAPPARIKKASNPQLELIFDGSKRGLKTEDSIAYNAGLTPQEYRHLKQVDPRVAMAEQAGKAEGELEMASVLMNAAKKGDAKSALEMLKHAHGWTAAQHIKHEGDMTITLTTGVPNIHREEEFVDPNDLGEG